MIQWYPGLTCQWSWERGWGRWRGGGGGEGCGSSEHRNYFSSSYSVAAHYDQSLAWQCEEEGRWEKCWRAPLMTILCFHTQLLFSQHRTLWPQSDFHFPGPGFTVSLGPWCLFQASLRPVSAAALCHGRNQELLEREGTHLHLLSGFSFPLWFKWWDNITLWSLKIINQGSEIIMYSSGVCVCWQG